MVSLMISGDFKYFVTGSHKQCKTEQMGLVDSDYSSLRSDHSTTNSEVGSIVSNTSGSVVSNTSLSSSFFSQRKHYIRVSNKVKSYSHLHSEKRL